MQILRFDDAAEVAPKRKKSSAGWVGIGLVAALFGVSTAFASSSIKINDEKPINLAQGVVAVTGCDPFIGLTPVTILKTDMTTFAFKELVIGSEFIDADENDYTIDTATATADPAGCNGVDFKIQFYPKPSRTGGIPTAVECTALLHGLEGNYGAVNGAIDLVGTPNNADGKIGLKCIDNAIYLRVGNRKTETLKFFNGDTPGIFDPAIFDYITLESTNTTY